MDELHPIQWLEVNRESLTKKYGKGTWIVFVLNDVVSHDEDLYTALKRANELGHDWRTTLFARL